MRMYDIIQKKKRGGVLTDEEISAFVSGYVREEIPDYQAAALLMAICFVGMTPEETAALTFAIRDSGEKPDFGAISGFRVDKHSTGGVGDKTSLVAAPIVAALGVKVAKMSGRGLGHTGGTVDKLEAIRGFRTDLSAAEFAAVVNRVGLAVTGQSRTLAPADRKLYALRDVTATVDSIPLIASSIMGKKLAADDDGIVLDVKCGSGAFMKTEEESMVLAKTMVDIGKRAGKKMLAFVTDMDRPLGRTIGNSLEVAEAAETLAGKGPDDLLSLSLELSAAMLSLAGKGSLEECRKAAEDAVKSGIALETLAAMTEAQGGEASWILDPTRFPKARCRAAFCAPQSGYLVHTDAEGYGRAALALGAGRARLDDHIYPAAGITLLAKTGDFVKAGECVALLDSEEEARLDDAKAILAASTRYGDAPPVSRPLLLACVE